MQASTVVRDKTPEQESTKNAKKKIKRRATTERKVDVKLNPNELEQVSGGCVFYHTMSPDGAYLRMDDGDYVERICKDCGARSYTKNGQDISKEEFEDARQQFNNPSAEHYYFDIRKK